MDGTYLSDRLSPERDLDTVTLFLQGFQLCNTIRFKIRNGERLHIKILVDQVNWSTKKKFSASVELNQRFFSFMQFSK
jgi:hypothetical protein